MQLFVLRSAESHGEWAYDEDSSTTCFMESICHIKTPLIQITYSSWIAERVATTPTIPQWNVFISNLHHPPQIDFVMGISPQNNSRNKKTHHDQSSFSIFFSTKKNKTIHLLCQSTIHFVKCMETCHHLNLLLQFFSLRKCNPEKKRKSFPNGNHSNHVSLNEREMELERERKKMEKNSTRLSSTINELNIGKEVADKIIISIFPFYEITMILKQISRGILINPTCHFLPRWHSKQVKCVCTVEEERWVTYVTWEALSVATCISHVV